MFTTYQRLKPDGPGWDTKFRKGSLEKHWSNLRIMDYLLARAETLYWERRPDPRELSVATDTVAV